MKKSLKILLASCGCLLTLVTTANAWTGSSYSVSYAKGQQNAALTMHNGCAAVGTYQNFNGGHVYTKASSNNGQTKTNRASRNAGFMIDGTSFSTYHEMVGGGWTNHYSR